MTLTDHGHPAADAATPRDSAATDGDERAAPRPRSREEMRRTYLRRRLAVSLLAAVVLAALVFAGLTVLRWATTSTVAADGSANTERGIPEALGTDAPTTAAPTTAAPTTAAPTTAAPTTAAPTTAAPTTAAPAPGITVGALTGGPGPIPVISTVPTFDPVVFITIDDGVHQDPAVLDIIRNRQVPVTMFLNEMYFRRDATFFQQLRDAGAVVANHTANHANLKKLDPAGQAAEICASNNNFTSTFGTAPTLFRPPYGNWNDITPGVAASCGMKAVVQWSTIFEAGQLRTQGPPLKGGDIILMHFNETLAADLTMVLDVIAAAGLRPANLAEYVDAAPPA